MFASFSPAHMHTHTHTNTRKELNNLSEKGAFINYSWVLFWLSIQTLPRGV